MKIALIGTHGTGKTTLLYALAAELKRMGIDVGIVNETARNCPFPINKKCSFQSQLWIMTAQITEELEQLQKYEHVFCDRSVLDAYIYSIVTNCSNKILEQIADTWIKSYDFLFKVPIIYKLQKDKIRDTNKKFQADVDGTMDRILKSKKIIYFKLPKTKQIRFIRKTIGL